MYIIYVYIWYPVQDLENGKMLDSMDRVGLLVVLGLTALWNNISVYIGPFPKERVKEEKG